MNQLEERLDLAVRAKRKRQVIEIGLGGTPAPLGDVRWNRNSGRDQLIGKRESVWVRNRFDNVEADMGEIAADLPHG